MDITTSILDCVHTLVVVVWNIAFIASLLCGVWGIAFAVLVFGGLLEWITRTE